MLKLLGSLRFGYPRAPAVPPPPSPSPPPSPTLTPMDTAHAPGPEDARRIRLRTFCKSNPVPGVGPLSYGFENQIESPGQCPTPPPKAAMPPQPSAPGTTPPAYAAGRPPPQPSAERCGSRACPGAWDLFHTPPPRPLFPICDSPRVVPRSPSAAFVSYLRPTTQTRDRETTPKLGPLSEAHSNEAIPSCADFAADQPPYLARVA